MNQGASKSTMLFDIMPDGILGWVFVSMGVFAICGATFQWGFFMNANDQSSRLLREVLGTTGFRIFQVVVGAIMVALGILLT